MRIKISMGTFSAIYKGDRVVELPEDVAFSDLSGQKVRPVLILSNDTYNEQCPGLWSDNQPQPSTLFDHHQWSQMSNNQIRRVTKARSKPMQSHRWSSRSSSNRFPVLNSLSSSRSCRLDQGFNPATVSFDECGNL